MHPKTCVVIAICTALTGCAGSMKLTLMPRDSGKAYSGQLASSNPNFDYFSPLQLKTN
jgi:hypothetical protein